MGERSSLTSDESRQKGVDVSVQLRDSITLFVVAWIQWIGKLRWIGLKLLCWSNPSICRYCHSVTSSTPPGECGQNSSPGGVTQLSAQFSREFRGRNACFVGRSQRINGNAYADLLMRSIPVQQKRRFIARRACSQLSSGITEVGRDEHWICLHLR